MIRVFVLDDDPAVTGFLRAKLSKVEGFEVETANDPAKAVDAITAYQPDIVVCDIDMGEIDGGTVAQMLKQRPATDRIPVLFLTSLVSDYQVRQSKGVIGGRLMISKDATMPELIARIQEILA